MIKVYEIFSGEDLRIAELIQRRRLQMLVHSYLYYEMDTNSLTDSRWYELASELADLQRTYPDIEKQVPFREGFENWEGTTGAFLPLDQLWIKKKAYLVTHELPKKKPTKKKQQSARKRLF